MGRRKSDPFEFLSDELEWKQYEQDQTQEVSSAFIDHKLPSFESVRTKFNFREWIDAYSPAIMQGGFVWDDVSRLVVEQLEKTGITRGARLLMALSPRSGKSASLALLASWLLARYSFDVLWVAG